MNNNLYEKHLYKTKLHMALMSLILLGAFNTASNIFYEKNIIFLLSAFINNTLKINVPFDKFIYLLILIASIIVIVKRETWLPFLGTSVFPDALIPLKTPFRTNSNITIKTRPNSKIAYWSSQPGDKESNIDVITAYGDYSNSGVVMSDNNGVAILPILIGTGYIVPTGKYIQRHVHYRVLGMPYGLIGKIKTVYY